MAYYTQSGIYPCSSGDESLLNIAIILSGTILNTWLFNNARGSVLLNMIMHTSVNLWVGVFNPLFSEADAARQTTWLVLAYVVATVAVTLLAGRDLSRKPETSTEPLPAGQGFPAY